MFVPTSKVIFDHKVIPAFGFSTVEMAKAIVEACEEENSSVILQISEKDARFLSPEIASSIAWALGQKTNIEVALQLDHATDIELITRCASLGYGSVMLAFDDLEFEKNVKQVLKIKEIVSESVSYFGCQTSCDHRREVIIEGGLSQFDQAKEFIEKTGIDILAPIINNKIDLISLEKIMREVSVPVVLHGCSSRTDEEIQKAVKLGVKKFNWSSCLREVWVKGLRESLSAWSEKKKARPSELLKRSVQNMKQVVKEKIQLIKNILK